MTTSRPHRPPAPGTRRAGAWLAFALCATAPPALAGAGPATAYSLPDSAGRLVFREVHVKHEVHRFAVWLPPGHHASRTWPAIVFLHGSGECGTDGERPTRVGLGLAVEAHPERWPFVVVFPQKPLEEEEWEERDAMVLAELASAEREFRIDRRHVALAGMSQGGHGTWIIGARHPGRWSCLIPICGHGRALTVAPRVAKLPVWAFHGLKDDVVDPDDSKAIVTEIRRERERVGLDPGGARLTIYPNANHDSWDAALSEPELPSWILARSVGR